LATRRILWTTILKDPPSKTILEGEGEAHLIGHTLTPFEKLISMPKVRFRRRWLPV
jgi:hypothetical protein